MRFYSIVFLTIALFFNACTAPILIGNCIDGALPAISADDDRTFIITIHNKKTDRKVTQNITCQNYYNSSCSVRGNHWDWAAKEDSKKVLTSTVDGPDVLITLPYCSALTKKRGKFYFKSASDGKNMYLNKYNNKYYLHSYHKDKSKIKYYELPVTLSIKEKDSLSLKASN